MNIKVAFTVSEQSINTTIPFSKTINGLSNERKKKANIRNRYNQVRNLTQDTIWERDKNTRQHHTQESQEVSPFPAGIHKAAWNEQTTMKHKKT